MLQIIESKCRKLGVTEELMFILFSLRNQQKNNWRKMMNVERNSTLRQTSQELIS